MKLTHYLNNIDVKTRASFKSGASLMVSTALMACASLATLTACSDEIASTTPTYTVGEADNAIVLSAGISEGGSGVMTRATRAGAEANHSIPGHKTFRSNTQLRLRVDGKWLRKGIGGSDYSLPHGKVTNTHASQTTTASIGDGIKVNSETTDTHNKVTFKSNEQLYWDDYGTADPDNMSTEKGGTVSDAGTDGRSIGLTIYGVAVDGKADAPAVDGTTAGKKWDELAWKVGTPSTDSDPIINQIEGWSAFDLLTSNNVQAENSSVAYSTDGTYKFDDRSNGKLLEFSHAMTKVTVELTAGEGFPTAGDPAVHQFQEKPSVTLLGFNYTGTVNVESKTSTATADSKTNISAHLAEVKATSGTSEWSTAPQTWAKSYKTKYDALVFPGNQFTATIDAEKKPTSTQEILKINADGNIYYVTAAQLVKAIANVKNNNTLEAESYIETLEQGVNYVLKVTVNKTKIDVTATIKNWDEVEAAEVNPVINVDATYGGEGSSTPLGKDSFSFYRSTSLDNGYSKDFASNTAGYFAAEATVSKSGDNWTFSTPLYWSDHNTHYQMRGVWPLTTTDAFAEDGKPRVETATHASKEYQVIKVKNVKYEEGKFPSDLAIGRPDVANDATCHNSDHDPQNLYNVGICATEGTINLDFEYMMSKIEVILSTTDGSDKVELEGAVVEVTNLYTTGEIRLGDREAITTGSPGSYTLNVVPGSGNENKRMDAIVPQNLTFSTAGAETNVRFKITITNKDAVLYQNAEEYNAAKSTSLNDAEFAVLTDEQKIKYPATKDIYYADVNLIKEKDKDTLVAPDGKWKSGKYYKYELKLSKTKIDVTAKLTDWVTVEASEDVWF